MSTIRTRCPSWARHDPRLIAVVVFPTPPFWLATAMTRAIPLLSGGGLPCPPGKRVSRDWNVGRIQVGCGQDNPNVSRETNDQLNLVKTTFLRILRRLCYRFQRPGSHRSPTILASSNLPASPARAHYPSKEMRLRRCGRTEQPARAWAPARG